MPDGFTKPDTTCATARQPFRLDQLQIGKIDSLGRIVREVLFRGAAYAIYRSDRGVYVHFSDHEEQEREQRRVYSTICPELCELRYLTSQMRGGLFNNVPLLGPVFHKRDSLYDHNIAQALMLLMESAAQKSANQAEAAAQMEKRGREIAERALDMAVSRVTYDNTLRYVRTCVSFGAAWIAACLLFWRLLPAPAPTQPYLLASLMGAVGAVFSVVVRAQAFQLKPCEDTGMNKLVSAIRVGMGGMAGPALLLLVTTMFEKTMEASLGHSFKLTAGMESEVMPTVALLGLLAGFAERLVPNLISKTADKTDMVGGTPVQSLKVAPGSSPLPPSMRTATAASG
jgi:hypothetical protein